MKTQGIVGDYHLDELKVALDPTDPRHCNPPPIPAHARVLDVGCGAGQTLIACRPGRTAVGLDVNLAALQSGRQLTDQVAFVCSTAERLPFHSGSFDVVIARVSLPYTNIRCSLREIRRVLRPGGFIWLVLHGFAIPWRSVHSANFKGRAFFIYVVLNSLLFHCTGLMVPFVNGGYESFQTEGGIRRALHRVGFREVRISRERHFVVTAS